MSNQHEDTYWTLWQVLNWIICRKPENLPPSYFTAIQQVRAGLPDRKLLPPLEIDGAHPGEAEYATHDPNTGQVTEWYAKEPLPVDSIVDDAENALTNTVQKRTIKIIVRSVGADLHEEANAWLWVNPHFTDRQGVRIRSTEFEDPRFLADEVKKEWPETSNGLLAKYVLAKIEQPTSSEAKQCRSKYEDWEHRQSVLVKGGMTLREAAEKIASVDGVDRAYVERETRRVRREREKSGIESGRK